MKKFTKYKMATIIKKLFAFLILAFVSINVVSYNNANAVNFGIVPYWLDGSGRLTQNFACLAEWGINSPIIAEWSSTPIGTDNFAILFETNVSGSYVTNMIMWGIESGQTWLQTDGNWNFIWLWDHIMWINDYWQYWYTGPCASGDPDYRITVYALSDSTWLQSDISTRDDFDIAIDSLVISSASAQFKANTDSNTDWGWGWWWLSPQDAVNTDAENLTWDIIKWRNHHAFEVYNDLNLITKWPNWTIITWDIDLSDLLELDWRVNPYGVNFSGGIALSLTWTVSYTWATSIDVGFFVIIFSWWGWWHPVWTDWPWWIYEQQRVVALDAENLTWDMIKWSNTDQDAVSSSLDLPKIWNNWTVIAWDSSDKRLITSNWTVSLSPDWNDQYVTIIWTVSSWSVQLDVGFDLVVWTWQWMWTWHVWTHSWASYQDTERPFFGSLPSFVEKRGGSWAASYKFNTDADFSFSSPWGSNWKIRIPADLEIDAKWGWDFDLKSLTFTWMSTFETDWLAYQPWGWKNFKWWVSFGIPGKKLIFSKPIKIEIPVESWYPYGFIKVNVKHQWDLTFNKSWISANPSTRCDSDWNATPSSNYAPVENDVATIYSCSASLYATQTATWVYALTWTTLPDTLPSWAMCYYVIKAESDTSQIYASDQAQFFTDSASWKILNWNTWSISVWNKTAQIDWAEFLMLWWAEYLWSYVELSTGASFWGQNGLFESKFQQSWFTWYALTWDTVEFMPLTNYTYKVTAYWTSSTTGYIDNSFTWSFSTFPSGPELVVIPQVQFTGQTATSATLVPFTLVSYSWATLSTTSWAVFSYWTDSSYSSFWSWTLTLSGTSLIPWLEVVSWITYSWYTLSWVITPLDPTIYYYQITAYADVWWNGIYTWSFATAANPPMISWALVFSWSLYLDLAVNWWSISSWVTISWSTLTWIYVYYDEDDTAPDYNDNESWSIISWSVCSTSTCTTSTWRSTQLEYTLTAEDYQKYLEFAVTPVSSKDPTTWTKVSLVIPWTTLNWSAPWKSVDPVGAMFDAMTGTYNFSGKVMLRGDFVGEWWWDISVWTVNSKKTAYDRCMVRVLGPPFWPSFRCVPTYNAWQTSLAKIQPDWKVDDDDATRVRYFALKSPIDFPLNQDADFVSEWWWDISVWTVNSKKTAYDRCMVRVLGPPFWPSFRCVPTYNAWQTNLTRTQPDWQITFEDDLRLRKYALKNIKEFPLKQQ